MEDTKGLDEPITGGGNEQGMQISADLIRGHINTIILRCLYDEDKYGYDIINEIEKQLPLAPFTNEWERLRLEHNYVGLTKIEKFLPWLFLTLYAAAILWPLVKFLLTLLCTCIGGST